MCKEADYFDNIFKNHLINKRLKDLGIGSNYIAFYYLSEILRKMIQDNAAIQSFSRQIYPRLAKKYCKNDCTVERDIRNIISVKWDTDLKQQLSHYWRKDSPPTCCQFIKIIKNFITDDFV